MQHKKTETIEKTSHAGTSTNLRLTKEWDLVKDSYKIEKIIGSGACGVVVRAKHRTSKNLVAIKHIRASIEDGDHYVLKKVLREIQILRHLTEMKENVHTVKILDLIVSEDMTNIFIVMNYMCSDLSGRCAWAVVARCMRTTHSLLVTSARVRPVAVGIKLRDVRKERQESSLLSSYTGLMEMNRKTTLGDVTHIRFQYPSLSSLRQK